MSVQRSYRAACPGCGAPVEFRSAASSHAVCAYCQSTVAREGDVLQRLGKMADVFDDHSPLQLLATGRYMGRGFTVVGRLQYRHAGGVWSEWRLLFDDDSSEAWLSEDNGNYVLSRPATLQREIPAPGHFRVGMSTAVGGKPFVVGFNESGVTLISAQGELPRLPEPGHQYTLVELRSERGEVLSIDYGGQPPSVYLGQGVRLDALEMRGLKDESVAGYRGRQIACPNCGSPVQVKLSTSRAVTCPACNSVIELSPGGAGGDGGSDPPRGYQAQPDPVEPLLPLGARGKLQGKDWQVVGFQHRLGTEPGDDEHFGWDEYLLYNQKAGFTFLVDAQDGWSMGRVLTSAPPWQDGARSVKYLGNTYRLDSAYHAETTWVAGEFYWPVTRGQKSWNQDFINGRGILSREQTAGEITWSRADRMDSALVAQAFGMKDRAQQFARSRPALSIRPDVSPLSEAAGSSLGTILFWAILVVAIIALETRCSECDPAVEDCRSTSGWSRSSGGSWGGYSGGYSGGGGHK